MPRPDATEHAAHYTSYVDLVPEEDILRALRQEMTHTRDFLRDVPESDAGLLHAPSTWTIKQVIGHLTDAEIVFGYRALRFARGDATSLPSFDENAYVTVAEFDRISLNDLADGYAAIRLAHLSLFSQLTSAAWLRRGSASGHSCSVRAIAFMILGHERHHMRIVRQRLHRAK